MAAQCIPCVQFNISEPGPSTILEGIIAYVEVRSNAENRSAAVMSTLKDLGAVIQRKLTPQVTHVIFKDGNKSTKDKARKRGLHLLSVLWVDSCKENQRHMPEKDYTVTSPKQCNTPIFFGKASRKGKSMQPEDFDKDVVSSGNRGEKKRRRESMKNMKWQAVMGSPLLSGGRAPSTGSDKKKTPIVYAPETQVMTPLDISEASLISPNITIPDTPDDVVTNGIQHALDLLDNTDEDNEANSQESSGPNITPLQRRLFVNIGQRDDGSSNGCVSPRAEALVSLIKPGLHKRKLMSLREPLSPLSAPPDPMKTNHTIHRNSTWVDSIVDTSKAKTNSRAVMQDNIIKKCRKRRNETSDTNSSSGDQQVTKRPRKNTNSSGDQQTTKKDGGKPVKLRSITNLTFAEQSLVGVSQTGLGVTNHKATPRRRSDRVTKQIINLQADILKIACEGQSTSDKKNTAINANTSINTDINQTKALDNKSHDKSDKRRSRRSIAKYEKGNNRLPAVMETNKQKESKKIKTIERCSDTNGVVVLDETGGSQSPNNQANLDSMSTIFDCNESIEDFITTMTNKTKNKKAGKPISPLRLDSLNKLRNTQDSKVRSSSSESDNCGVNTRKNAVKKVNSKRKHDGGKDSGKLSGERKMGQLSNIVMTSLHNCERDVVKLITKKLGKYHMSNKVDHMTSHVICGGPRRTLNVLHGIARGCWLLSSEWILKSLDVGRWLDEEPYEMNDYFPSAQVSRLERYTAGPSYVQDFFSKAGTIFVAENVKPTQSELSQLITLCGGLVTTCMRKADLYVGPVRKDDRKKVSEQWVLDSITEHRMLSLDQYILDVEELSDSI